MTAIPPTTDIQPASETGIDISSKILSAKPLSEWRGSITTFDGFTGTLPDKELPNAE